MKSTSYRNKCIWFVTLAALVSGALAACATSSDWEPPLRIPTENFLRVPDKSSFELSPDGQSYTYLSKVDGRMQLSRKTIADREISNLTPGTALGIREYLWVSDDRLLTVGTAQDGEVVATLVTDEGSEEVVVFSGEGTFGILDPLVGTPQSVAVMFGRADKPPQPHRLDVVSGRLSLVASVTGEIDNWVFDNLGQLRSAMKTHGLLKELLYRKSDSDSFRTVLQIDASRELFIPLAFTSDDAHLFAYSNIRRERVALVVMNPETGRETKVLYEDPQYDLFGDDEADSVSFSTQRRELSYAFYTTERRTYRFFDSWSRRIVSALQSQFPGQVIRLLSSSIDETKILVKVSGDRLAGEYYLYDATADKVTFLESDCPWLEAEHLAPKQAITFAARDGTTIHGYLVLPVGVKDKNLPLVVYPHGGPHWRDVWEMGRFKEIQLLANRGYAVLQVNFRGSTGYGKTFLTSGFKQNGLIVQNDITDGVRYLVSEGVADPTRVAIIGGSYGGYAVLAGLAFTPELYACGVDLFGVSNFFTFLDALSRFTDMSVMYEQVGHPVDDRELLERTSPLFHADSIRAPLLMAHGGQDPIVSSVESEQMVEALESRGIPVRYIFYEDEGHGYFSHGDNWLRLWQAIEEFLGEHLGTGNE